MAGLRLSARVGTNGRAAASALAGIARRRGETSVRVELIRAVVIAGVAAGAVLLFAPPAGDAAAHLYRIYLIERGVWVWDTFWYKGDYPFFTYSLLYYPLAALVGNTTVSVATALGAAAAFAAMAVRQWGRVGVWPARVFSIGAAGTLITGTYAYGTGLAVALGALVAAQHRHRWLLFVLAAVTLGLSPLAFAFLLLVLAATVVARRRLTRADVAIGGGLGLLVGGQWVVMMWLGYRGSYPFEGWTLLGVTVVAGCGLALAVRKPAARLMGTFFALWLGVVLLLFLFSSPLGDTVTRLNYVVFPLMLVTVLLTGWRPRWLAITGLCLAGLYNVVPYVASVTIRSDDDRPANVAYWQPAMDYLRDHHSPDHLVEVVATESHWEAYWLPRAGVPIVRGWYRQTDRVRNDVLYREQATPQEYRQWLDRNAVRYVVLPEGRLDVYTGKREERLVRAKETGLVPVMHAGALTVYEVPRAAGLMTGAGPARVTQFDHRQVSGSVDAPGRYELRLRWSPYWRLASGDACINQTSDGTIGLRADRPGPFRLTVADLPGSASGGAKCASR
jgi:hypothetical protein